MELPKIGDTVTTEQALELCRYFNLEYLVERIVSHPDKYREWKFDGCSGLPDEVMGFFTGCNWENITYKCCLPHDLCYGYGEPGNGEERKRVDLEFYDNLLNKTGMKKWCASAFLAAVRIGGAEVFGLSFSWAFAHKKQTQERQEKRSRPEEAVEMEELCFGYCESPIGLIEISATPNVIRSLNFVEQHRDEFCSNALVEKAVRQIEEYFKGNRRAFDVPIDPQGTPFQKAVWRRLLEIPYGRTTSYGDIARAIGNPKAVRAVGGANGRNPIAIIVPCHRIIGSDGSMTGYGSGIWRKEWLLKHEGLPIP